MGKKKIQDIDDKMGLFISEDSFNLDVEYGRHFINNDAPFQVIVHKVNVIESKTHKLYGEAKAVNKKFFPPVKINGLIDIKDGDQFYMADNGVIRDDVNQLHFKVYLKDLEELDLEINRGDILEYNPTGKFARYYEVSNAHNINDAAEYSFAGITPYWKRIEAIPVKEDVILP